MLVTCAAAMVTQQQIFQDVHSHAVRLVSAKAIENETSMAQRLGSMSCGEGPAGLAAMLVAAPETLAEGMLDRGSLAGTEGDHVLLQQCRELQQEPVHLLP